MSARVVLCLLILGRELWELFLSRLAAKQRKRPLPTEVADIYNAERWGLYLGICKDEFKLSCIHVLFARSIDVALIFSSFFSWVDGLARDNYLLGLLVPMAIIHLVNAPIAYLVNLYDEFKIQKRYGQSNHTLSSFNKDYFIGDISSFVLSLVVTSLLVFSFRVAIEISLHAGGGYAGAFKAARMFVPVMFGLALLFVLCALAIEFALYKFRPMPEGKLRETLEHMLSSCRKKVRWITVYNESAKSNEKNAFLLNIPGFRMISIADNAVEGECSDETLAVLAHEVGHLKHRFVPSDLFKYLSSIGVCAVVVVLLSNTSMLFSVDAWIQDSFCLKYTSAFLVIQFLSILTEIYNLMLGIPLNYARRRNEYEADRNAVLEGYGNDLAEMLKSSSSKELRGVNPHPFIEFLEYDHPALPKRLRAIYKEMERQQGIG